MVFLIIPSLAFAQEIVDVSVLADTTQLETIDLAPILTTVLTFLGLIGTGVGIWAWRWLSKKLGVESLVKEEKVREALDKYIEEGVKYGINRLDHADWTKIETKNKIVAYAANHVVEHGPNAMKQAGVNIDALAQKIEAKLLDYDKNPGHWDNLPYNEQ